MQEQILMFFNNIATPILDNIAEVITMLGEQYFFILIISLFFWNISKKNGVKLSAAFFYSTAINSAIKMAVHSQRPFEKLDWIKGKRVETATGYSFPSGHTQSSTTFFVSLATIIKRSWFTFLVVILVFFVGITRVYLGVHWPIDVLGGWILGIIIALLVSNLVDKVYDNKAKMKKIFFCIQAVLVIASILLFIADLIWLKGSMKITDFFKIVGVSTGAIWGFFLEEDYFNFSPKKGSLIKKIIRYVLGLVLTIVIISGLKKLFPHHYLFDFLRYGIVGIFITCLWPAAGMAIGLFSKSE
ncbi:MAG: phosphatase PAP2 family protein [Spirochaetales bacterium]|nr:phosphatase PAP2 family protein [Spirochaetales bacterium]